MSRTLINRPVADGFWMPAEWTPHTGCWMIWPERPDNWRLNAAPARKAFAEVAGAIAEFEPVTVAASPTAFDGARRLLPDFIRVVEIASDDCWARDVGPTFLVDGKGGLRGADWRFNAWGGADGGLYARWDQDERVARKILEIERLDRYAADFILEGGAIHVDGEGTLLTTEQCLLNPNRNPDLDRAAIERNLRDYLGVAQIIWLGHGVVDDETDGHIDNLACFARPGVVLLTWTEDRDDPQYAFSRDAFERLSKAKDAKGRPLEVIKLEQPRPMHMTDEEAQGLTPSGAAKTRGAGDRLAASYVNFYLANGAIIMPLLDPRSDAAAAETLSRAFPDRKIKGVPTREVLLGGGNIHCITQQQPAARAG